MKTYVKPIIQDDTPDVVILHIGCNDISNKSMSENDIAEGIINIGRYCKEHNVNNVTILHWYAGLKNIFNIDWMQWTQC